MARVETTLKRALEIDATALEAYGLLAQVYIRTGRMDAAKREFERLIQQQPKSVAGYTMIGMIEQAQGNTREAIRRYEAAVAIDPRAAPAANNLAWLYAEQGGSLDTALALAQTAKAQLPNQPEVNDTLAWIYYRKNLPALAIPLLRESIEREPGNAIYHYHLGLAYARSGDRARAREALTRALRLRPEFDGAAEARRVLNEVAS
jgi:tetratricopeptide (TPR) repeat protein